MQESINDEQTVTHILREQLTEERAMMLASTQSLAKYWDTPEEDEAWAYLQKATS
jgi:hypothetical protein